ncbi:gamma-glutamyl-gamma-aminobutyrate hydrolase family protein [Leucobacter coleopterorum]|nr:gamma-glutamyl-gamma-aminobutyrate hydrolase family protein [Leucobacter coleopterorum]
MQAADAERLEGPAIPMVVSTTFPGIGAAAQRMQDEFTRIAFEAVRLAGGWPILVDSAAQVLANASDVFAGASAIVFLGGGDVETSLYGYDGPPPENEYGVDKRADEYCIDLIREAVDRDLPTLAICRGSQLLNVTFGGTLIPDIEQFSLHRGGAGSPLFINEDVHLEGDSEIARILGRTEVTVRNGHHQAVAEVAPELRATAFAHDGIVEGTQHREASWVIGIQWHPEEPEANEADRALIFGALVERARPLAASLTR